VNIARSEYEHDVLLVQNGGGLSHNDYCALSPNVASLSGAAAWDPLQACVGGSASFTCATLGGGGTDPGTRMHLFGFRGQVTSETGAAGNDGEGSVDAGWLAECAGQDGHRQAVLSAGSNVTGTGFVFAQWFDKPAAPACWGSYGFAGYGSLPGVTLPRIGGAAHDPASTYFGQASAFTFTVNWYDPAGPPASAYVVLDGKCTPLTTELGTGGNLSLIAKATLDASPHVYYVVATAQDHTLTRYPDLEGSGFRINGGSTMFFTGPISDFTATGAPAATCP
jgi:hypothetical protein